MKVQTSYRQIWFIAFPIMISGVTQNIINVTDTAFLGRVSEVALGAGALAGVFYFALVMIGFGFALGAQILIARRMGEGNTQEVGKIIDHQLIILAILAIILFILMRFFSPLLLKFLVKSEPIYHASIVFMDYRSWGVFFSFMGFLFRAFYIGIGSTRIIIWSTGVTAVVNVFLGYAFIFGNFGFPRMEIAGAGLANVIAEAAGVVVVVADVYIRKHVRNFSFFRFEKINLEMIGKISSLSIPMVLQFFISLASWFLFFVVVESMGSHELAISNIIRSIYMAYMIPTWGFASATNSMVSNIIGQQKHDEVLRMVRKIVILNLSIAFFLALSVLVFPKAIVMFYTNDAQLIQDTVRVMYILVPILLMYSVSMIIFNSVTGSGGTRYSLLSEIFCVTFYLTYIFLVVYVFKLGLIVAWGSELIYWSVMIVMSYIYLHREKWKDISL